MPIAQEFTAESDVRQQRRRVPPAVLVVAGAGCISASAMFVKLAEVNAGTAAFLRCAIALFVLVPLALRERRRHGRMHPRLHGYAAAAGVCLGLDFAMWTQSILDLGAAIATVLVNVQVLAFPLLARIFEGTRMTRRFLLISPLMLAGIALAGGVVSHSEQVDNVLRGSLLGIAAGIAYAGYLYLNRVPGSRGCRHVVTPVCVATATATVTTGVSGLLTTGITLDLPLASWGWLIALALLGQVAAWLLLSTATPRLAPNTSSTLLLLQPVLAIVFGLIILAETPTTVQLAGCALVIGTVWYANRVPSRARSSSGPVPDVGG